MAEDNMEEITEALKRMKQLENQNLKLRRLLETAEDMSSQDADGIIQLKEEARNLEKTVDDLEKEKEDLQRQLNEIQGAPMLNTLHELEQEHVDLQTKLESVLENIEKDRKEIESLKSEDDELQKALKLLQDEQEQLKEKFKQLSSDDTVNSHLAEQTVFAKPQVYTLVEPKPSLTRTIAKKSLKDYNSEENIISNFKNLEKVYRDYIEVLEEKSLQQKISTLETRNVELMNESEGESQLKLNSTIIKSNTDILHKIKDAKSKLVTSIEANTNLIGTIKDSKDMEVKISELERQKDLLYAELEESLENSSKEISRVRELITDGEIRRLVNEIEVQKAVLLYNLKTLKMKNEQNTASSSDEILKLPDVPKVDIDSKDVLPISSQSSQVRPVPASTTLNALHAQWPSDTSGYEPSTSNNPASNEHQRLEEQVTRLENERKELLKQLQTISETSAQRFEERQLQTQSELHNTFMREESSQEIVAGKNYDDATNQLYADEDTRLEQRIRELENENARIKKELEVLSEQIRTEQSGAFQYTTKTLRERINELESKSQRNKD